MLHATCNPESIPLTIPKLCRRASFSKKERFLGHPNTSPLCMPPDKWETLRAPWHWWTSRGPCFRVFKVIEQIERVFPGCVATCSGGWVLYQSDWWDCRTGRLRSFPLPPGVRSSVHVQCIMGAYVQFLTLSCICKRSSWYSVFLLWKVFSIYVKDPWSHHFLWVVSCSII